MSTPELTPLAMSQTKDDLVKHLNISAETYNLMAKEADTVYRWLISETCHLKKNCKGNPPYDWSDIVEKSKDEAMNLIVQNGTPETAYYWNLAGPTQDCPNWIARWFLYHKFRYRDGRNRNTRTDHRDAVPSDSAATLHHHRHSNHQHSHRHSQHSYHPHHRQAHQGEDYYSHSSYHPGASMNADDGQRYNYHLSEPSSSTGGLATYSSSQPHVPPSSSYNSSISRQNAKARPYDPVRDL
ncbi:hypothetical protein DSL72_008664 [Monilinia vaccinii-corymbosi]|uniref:Uncharacterized protein n=1 Tax=Monilinia vaccinii-corymbosi TaxID=61207 RepID=A0A8A3PS25_9HELO|nr:hypothetical protein DSL72_008664 [Monilinia vaccinii-corymbosi]